MAVLTVQKNVVQGLNPTLIAAASGGDSFPNDGRTIFIVKNGGGGSINVTVNSPTPCSHGFEHDQVIAVAAGAQMQIGPFSQDRFNNTTGQVDVTYSAVTTVTVGAVSVG